MRLSFRLNPSVLRAITAAFLTAVLFVLVAPGCGRSSLELEDPIEGGTPNPGLCSAATCPNGCCDLSGVCRVGGDTRACGSRGARCNDCIATGFQFCDSRSKSCARNQPNCGPSDCPGGCCSFDGGSTTCRAGSDPQACGRSGQACTDCSVQGRTCDTVTRVCSATKCDASNCSGCCVGDKCLSGVDMTACGTNGQQCTSCTATNQTCRAAGGGGGRCEGVASCSPATCAGCCDGVTCLAGTDSIACGRAGGACTNCGANAECVPPGQPNERTCRAIPRCTPANCAGCCAGDACVVATTPAACGKGAEACRACGANETCVAGVCTPGPGCTPANCAAGCCIGNVCVSPGNQNTACGVGAVACANCQGLGQVCQGGACVAPACGPANCAGCCQGNVCVAGTDTAACGKAGAACTGCAGDQGCLAQVCTSCNPANCAGCCRANKQCDLGFTNANCGSGGAACAACAAPATCDTNAAPRVCSNNANTCPRNYGACPANTATPVTPSLQNVCDDALDLDSLAAACANAPDSASCTAAFQVLQATKPACATCVRPFNTPFEQGTGIFRCTAPFVSAACNGSTGCAIDCGNASCNLCPAADQAQCRDDVNFGGQCNAFVQASAICINGAIQPGDLCSPATYPNYGGWLRAVADHFCGNGP